MSPSSESLIPRDREYGERKALEEQRSRAGIPAAPQSGPAPAVQAGGAPAAAPSVPPGYDVLSGRQPSQPQLIEEAPPQTHKGMLQELAANSPNPFYREFAARLLQIER